MTFPALRLARSSRLARRVARVLLVLLAVAIVSLAFAPWQQTVSGTGRVVAYSPLQRQQPVEIERRAAVDRRQHSGDEEA